MIEVLITLFVLSIGLLGVASMQFVGSFNNKSALAKTQGVFVAQQMAERMRASVLESEITDGLVVNNGYFVKSNYNFDNLSCSGGSDPFNCYCHEVPPSVPNCISGQCNASEFAIFEAYQMSCTTVSANPAAQLLVSCEDTDNTDADTCTAGSMHKIIVRWPAQAWQNFERAYNASCNAPDAYDYDCVILEIVL